MRLIDADKMLKRIESWNTSDAMDKALYNFTLNRIVEQPTVDAVPVIRCKDCKHSEPWYRDRMMCFLWNEDGDPVYVWHDGFCNYAERKKNDNNRTY